MCTLLGARLFAMSSSEEELPERLKAAVAVIYRTGFPFDAILLVHSSVKAALQHARKERHSNE
jgi:hypothetical protein